MPLRLNALLCRSYTCPCQCSATPLVCYSMPKHYVPSLCPSSAYLRLALAPFFFSMPLLCISLHCPHIPLLCQNHAPLSHGNTLPGPFIAIQCPYFAMPVLTSRCSASAIRFLSLPQRNVAYPRLCLAYLHSAFALLIYAIAVRCCSSLNIALAPLIPASPSRYPTKPLPDISNQYLNKSFRRPGAS